MNIEKLVSSYFTKKRSESTKSNKQITQLSSSNKCYQPEHHSFQPSVHEIPKSLYRVTTKTQCSREDIVQRLYTDRRSVQNRRTMQKLDAEDRQFKQVCTFQPFVNVTSRRVLKTEVDDENPFDRLYDHAINKKKLSQSLNYIEQNKQNYSFQPQTNYRAILNSQTRNLKPIYQRLDEVVKQKREKMKMLQQNMVEKQMRPKPTINEISEKIVTNKEEFKKSILERVSVYIEQKKKKVENDAAQHQRDMLKQCTFRPQVNNTADISTNFQTRQEEYLRKIQQKMSSRIIQHNFHPEINKISEILVRQERQAETFEDKINRLANNANKTDKILQIERELYQQCTFVPEINLISKCLAAEHVSHKCNHTPKEQQYEFKPKINKLSDKLAKQAKMRKTQSADFKQDRHQYLNHLKMEIEYEELKQCTFKPKLNLSKPKSNTNLAQVRGFENFLKKIDKINQIKDEEKIAEIEVVQQGEKLQESQIDHTRIIQTQSRVQHKRSNQIRNQKQV